MILVQRNFEFSNSRDFLKYILPQSKFQFRVINPNDWKIKRPEYLTNIRNL